ncbi:AraC family transcriptional regulator [Ruminococcaceae bacterium OttesenSCG-928-O06]|nr:AraC family transcriptional regulator [Ruminococcaceae bacterium OttesenSCG-928-O06]
MDSMERLNSAMRYIEEHLTNAIDFEVAGRIAGCSEYHFRRMFSFLAGMPIGEYVRRRRLSLAAEDLRQSDGKIIDLALRYGYDSPDAFTKAFAAMHGMPPSRAKLGGAPLASFPPMTFQLTIKGGNTMEYRIVEKEAFHIVGFKKRITLQFEGENRQMDSLVAQMTGAAAATLKALCNIEPKGILNVSANFAERAEEGTELDQYLGVATTRPLPEGFDALAVAPGQWAVFTARGPYPKAMQDTWARIFAEWLPTASYQLTSGPEMLWNEGTNFAKPDFRSEIWIPVEPNRQKGTIT